MSVDLHAARRCASASAGGGTDLPSYYREHGGFLVGGSDRQVRVHAHAHRVPAALSAEVLRVRGGRRPERDPASDPAGGRSCATGTATRWRSPRGGRPGRHRPGLLRRLHGLPAQGAGARAARGDARRRRSRRTRARSRSTSSVSRSGSRISTSRRTAASARTRSTRTAPSTSSRSMLSPKTLGSAAKQPPALLYRRDAQRRSTHPRRPGQAHRDRTTSRC